MTLLEVMIALAVLALATGFTMARFRIPSRSDAPVPSDARVEAIRKGQAVVTWDSTGRARLDEPDGGIVEEPAGTPP